MSYQVIARKYRPARFADITAQEHITGTIQNSLRMGRVGHGYIFSGLRGVGKTTAARVFAKAVNCERMIDDPKYLKEVTEPCGECESCRDFDAGASLNISEFDAASNNGVDDIRLLRDNVRYGPQKGRYRVYIIDEVHMLTTAAFNAFLKTLEEPPPHAIFIFATTELHKIPATIASRCQRFNFKRIPLDRIQGQLQQICDAEGIQADADALQLVARKAQGSMRDAQSILDQVIAFALDSEGERVIRYEKVSDLLSYIDDEHFFMVTEAIANADAAAMLDLAGMVNRNGYDEQDFIEKLIEHFRNFLIIHNLRSSKLIERPEPVKERYQRDALRLTPQAIMAMTDFLMQTQRELKFYAEHQFRFELALLKLIELGRGTSQMATASADEKKKSEPVAPPSAPVSAVAPPSPAARRSKPAPAPESSATPSGLPPVPEPPPPATMTRSTSRAETRSTPAIDLGSWKQAFSKFGSNADQHLPARKQSRVEESGADSDSGAPVAVLEQLRMEWGRFLEHLSAKGLQVMVSHLHASELMACSPSGVVQLGCCRKFSFEELQHDSALLESELSDFYKLPLKLAVRYDAERDACTREKSIFTMFQELTESNEVVRYLITEFGAELAY
ncbi:DNA polymerase III subunit gamma/tau [Chlorobaculum thiosulfatiphilum]|uniref:DNA polymerase III subunit gamma/tau n=1 Tax=Chlorobaculum thiosulfatiphilum TaxID=115852 RepID=A0A5C4S5Y6_CHLTI|nr:DNA polymerase III subunit gamma/tau [Chlorobaculum thiosulfatiphilum]TNJ38439.1 DNA polymerase III subunit gamma/tau [Chlorobaculum thiosulfatiphilum]